ncbi:MAG TPA: protein phosphatase 2C domain-containing protein [Candidatus Hydrogenedentes bacterium]|nr:protein phosphatase 2C domain-containing protein [Candidatus Hydrogenedentota bacterium]HOL77647.1 protein phosphatase 2C domain-containing protein [Candidatus Hydrogenedentota bacterium]HPO87371.1 protein phosphatase 2C domain-containing protein [Candidatus Hydrogenedentota bacterium]
MRIEIAAQTDVGRRKRHNEDSFGVFRVTDMPECRLIPEGALLCVADGLGGHLAGDIASKLAVAILKDMLKQTPPEIDPDEENPDKGILDVIRKAILRANESIFQTNRDNGLLDTGRPMGTTLLAVLVTPRKVFIGNVGDSRCYHIREGEIIARTEDHSWVDEQVKLGLMSKAEAESDGRKNLVTRSIGTSPEVEPDVYVWHTVPGDTLLLCTDGLVNMVKDAEIVEEFKRNASPAEICHRLVVKANDNGGKDNITVVVADIEPSLGTVIRRKIWTFSKKRGAGLLWFLLAVLYGVACFAAGYFTALHR